MKTKETWIKGQFSIAKELINNQNYLKANEVLLDLTESVPGKKNTLAKIHTLIGGNQNYILINWHGLREPLILSCLVHSYIGIIFEMFV